MRALLLIAIIAAAASALDVVPRFTLDLSLPPEQRWRGSVAAVLAAHPWNMSFGPLIAGYNSSLVHPLLSASDVGARVSRVVETRFPTQWAELAGVAADFAAAGHPEVDRMWLSVFSWFHELDHGSDIPTAARVTRGECTGILVAPADPLAEVIHGRNLDQDTAAGRNVTLHITAVNGSTQALYEVMDFYWMSTGFVTASKLGVVTLQENWRWSDYGPLSVATIASRIEEAATIPQVMMFRYVLEGTNGASATPDFYSTLKYLNTSTFAAPFYVIMSGKGRQGAVLSISFDKVHNVVDFLGQTPPSTWFLVQTNWDHWKKDENRDRRTHAQDTLAMLGQEDGATRLGVWQTLSEWPVHNQYTFYSALMQVDRPLYGFARRAMLPVRDAP